MKRSFLAVAIVLIMMVSLNAADIKLKGLVQTWFSYADQDVDDDSGYGFTIRRVRFAPFGSISKNIKWGFQVYWDKQSVGILDAFMDITMSKGFKLKFGQFAAPGAISGALTSSAALDLIERASVSQKWGGNSGLLGYRAIGIQAHGNVMDDKLYYAVMIANPQTSSLFTPGVGASDYEHEHNGVMLWARLEAKPAKGFRLGAFYGGGKETDTDYKRDSYGAFLMYAKDSLNIKAEYIAGKYGVEGLQTEYSGMYGVLGYKFGKVEPTVRYGFYKPDDGMPDGNGVEQYNNITLGVNYQYGKSVKFQANYVLRSESMFDNLPELKNNLFYLCFQYSFKSK
ncbi:MAG: porin [bacterium]|nr:porin [bacterium]